MRMQGLAATMLAGLSLGGCIGPTGPVVGDWRGREEAIEFYRDRVTELILDGTPNTTVGTYHMVSSVPGSGLVGDPRDIRWSDRWQRRVVRPAGMPPFTVYHLDNAPPGHLADYALLSNGALLPMVDPLRPDTGPEAMRVAMLPLPRTAYGYGRP